MFQGTRSQASGTGDCPQRVGMVFHLRFTENHTLSPVVADCLWPLQAGAFHTCYITRFSLWHSDWVPV